jgi:hypothetical protein
MKEMENLAKIIIRDRASNQFILSQTDLPDEEGKEGGSTAAITKDVHGPHGMDLEESKNDYSQKNMGSNREREDLNCNSDRLDLSR